MQQAKSFTLADIDPWGKAVLNRHDNEQMLVIADDFVAVAEMLQAAGMIARSKHVDMVELQAAAAEDATGVVDTPSIALGRCDIAVAAQNFGSPAQGLCMATGCRKRKDFEIQTAEAAAEDGRQVAVVERAVLADNLVSAHGYTMNAVVVHPAEEASVHEPDIAHVVAVRRLRIGMELSLTATAVSLRERMHCTASWKHCEPGHVSHPEQRERSVCSRGTSML